MRPMLDPRRDLKGATREKLARALLRNRNLHPGPDGRPVARDQAPAEPVPVDQPGNRLSPARKRS